MLTVQPSAKDNWLREFGPTLNYGTHADLILADRDARTRRMLLEFDLSGIPGGETIISASLQLYYHVWGFVDPVGRTAWAYKLTRTDWVELQSTWNIYKTSSDWTTPGGDYVTSGPVGGSTVFSADYGWMSWNVLAIVQDAYAAGNAAELLVKFATEGLASDYSQPNFYSNNYTDDTDLRPKLVIDYAIPAVGRSFGYIIG